MKMSRIFLVLLIAVTIGGCATRPVALTPESKQRVGNAEVILEVPQEEIFADIDKSNSAAVMGGGALFAIIDSIVDNDRAKTAEKKVEPYRNALGTYDFPGKLKSEVEQAAAGLSWLNRVSITVDRSADGKLAKERVKESTANSVFVMNTHYSLSPDFTQVIVKAKASILPVKAADAKPLYLHDFTVSESMPVNSGGNTPEEVWTRDNGAALRAALDSAIAKLAMQVADDADGRHAANAETKK